MKVSNAIEIDMFYKTLYIRYGYEQGRIYKGLFEDYTNLLLEYNIKLIGNEVEEISDSQEDDKNINNLLVLNKKEGMNPDIFRIFYNSIISTEGQKKFDKYVAL